MSEPALAPPPLGTSFLGPDGRVSQPWVRWLQHLWDTVGAQGVVGAAGFSVAGAGLTATGSTVDVAAGDSSIVVSADDIRVGAISDANHGALSGGTLHAAATNAAAGFASAAHILALEAAAANIVTNTANIATLTAASHAAVTLGAFGSAPDAKGQTIAGQVLTAQPADATHPGGISLFAQTLGAGPKTVASLVSVGAISAENGHITTGTNGVLETLQVDSLSADVGYIKFSNPNARPGVSARNLDGTGRSDIRQRSGGGWDFAGQSGGTDAVVPPITFTMDAPNGRFGVGISASLTADIHLEKATAAGSGVQILARNTTADGLSQILVRDNGTNTGGLEIIGSTFATTARPTTRGMVLLRAGANSQGLGIQAAASGTSIEFWTNNAGSHALRAEITAAGLLQVGGVTVLTQTNTLASITNKSFSGLTHTGTLALGTSSVTGSWSFSGTPTIGGAVTLSGAVAFGSKITHLVQTSITAFATGGQASATALTGEHCYVTTCASAGDSVKLPVAVAGYEVTVFNAGAQSCNVFPQTSSDAGAGVNTAVAVAAGAGKTFYAQTTTQWRNK